MPCHRVVGWQSFDVEHKNKNHIYGVGWVLDNLISMWINIWDEDTCKTTSQHNTENKYMHITNLKRKGGSETWLPTLNLGTPLFLFHLVSFLEDNVTCKSTPHLSFDTHYSIFQPFIVMATFFCVTFHLICIYFLPFLCPLTFLGILFS